MSAGTPAEKVNASIKIATGFDPATGQFNFQNLVQGYAPAVATNAITYLIPKINGFIRRAI